MTHPSVQFRENPIEMKNYNFKTIKDVSTESLLFCVILALWKSIQSKEEFAYTHTDTSQLSRQTSPMYLLFYEVRMYNL